MSHYEQRSKEAPMDIDSLGHEHGRLGLYQNHNNSAFDEGPARKRECLLGLVGRSVF